MYSLRTARSLMALAVMLLVSVPAASPVRASGEPSRSRSITDTSQQWPSGETLARVLLFRDYNTRVVVIGTILLGAAAGVIGTFAYLRRRALMGDALSHATLPGIAIVFILLGAKSLPLLLVGATITGVLGVLAVIGLRTIPRIREDAAIGIVLSVFFGFGMVLLGVIQQMRTGQEAGLSGFIYGKAAAMLAADAWLIGVAAIVVVAGCGLLFKEFRAVCFDPQFASSIGVRVHLVDFIMMALVVLTTVVGLQAVGLILIVALLIIPAAAARFWTDDLKQMTILSALFGALSGYFGSTFSALLPRLPTGAVIVLCAGGVFGMSMLLAPKRGLLAASYRHWALRRNTAYQHLLRALAELEEQFGEGAEIPSAQLAGARQWSPLHVRRCLSMARRRGAIERRHNDAIRLTPTGRAQARRMLRNHRLWELYLIRHADIAPSHVDRDADDVEHVLSEANVRELEDELTDITGVPPSPHGSRSAS